jgi:hypothetical protein
MPGKGNVKKLLLTCWSPLNGFFTKQTGGFANLYGPALTQPLIYDQKQNLPDRVYQSKKRLRREST